MNHKNNVCCHITDCAFHSEEDHCDAKDIVIDGLHNAKSCENTMCQTFTKDYLTH